MSLKTVKLEDGTEILIEAIDDVLGYSENVSGVASIENVYENSNFLSSLTKLSTSVKDAIESSKPDEAQVEFSIGVTVKEGKLISVLCGGSVSGNLKVTLKWK